MQKLRIIVKVLSTSIPDAVELCRVAEMSILNPMQAGHAIPTLMSQQKSLRHTLTLADAITPRVQATVQDVDASLAVEPGVAGADVRRSKPGAL